MALLQLKTFSSRRPPTAIVIVCSIGLSLLLLWNHHQHTSVLPSRGNATPHHISVVPALAGPGRPRNQQQQLNRQEVWVARYSEALAEVATGDVYMLYNNSGSPGIEGRRGIYQTPPLDSREAPRINAWQTYELPTLQRNPGIRKIYGVDMSLGSPLTNVEWIPGHNGAGPGQYPLLPASPAGTFVVPPPAAMHKRRNAGLYRRGLPDKALSTAIAVDDACVPESSSMYVLSVF